MFNVTASPQTLIQAVLWAFAKALVEQFNQYKMLAFLLCFSYTVYLIQIKKTRLPIWIPHQLIIVVVSTLLTFAFRLDEKWGLATVKDIESALSAPHFPSISNIIGLGPYTLTIAMISFVQIYVIAQRVDPNLNPNSELFASGATNFLCNIMNGMPVTNSFSCSSVLLEQHVQTPLTSYVASFVLFITIVFLTRLGVFYYLPKQALAAIVVSSVWRLVDFSSPVRLWKYSKMDATVWIFTFVLTMVGGITIGVLSGIMLSLVLVVLRIARPRVVCVGFNMATLTYGDLRKDQELLVYPNILIWRFDAPLYFVNIGFFQEKLMQSIEDEVRPIDVIIVTCERVVDIDSAALAAVPTVIKSVSTYKRNLAKGEKPRRILLTCIHGRLETVLFSTAAIPIYVPEEYDRLPIEAIEHGGKFPVVFKKLEDSIRFAQRLVTESYGVYDTSPYPNVSFLTDAVIEAARYISPGAQLRGAAATTVATVGNRGKRGRGGDRGGVFSDDVLDEEDEDNMEGAENEVGGSMALAHTLSNLSIIGDETADTVVANDEANREDNASGLFPAATPLPTFLDEGVLERLKRLKRLSTFTPDRELIGVIGVVRHAEQTPKQKKKIFFTDFRLLELAFRDLTQHPSKETLERARSPEELDDFFRKAEELLQRGVLQPAREWRRVLVVVRSRPQSLHIQIKPFVGTQLASFGDASMADVFARELIDEHRPIDAALLIVKWGGVLTKGGISQAHVLGEKLFARFFAAGDIPLSRLLRFISHPRIYSTDQSRVYNTALVVMRAITQSPVPLTKRDIIIDDGLMKKLSWTAKRLLQEEYRYYEMLLHINSQAASRHFFHIPGFRQLLLIPLLDRPFATNRIASMRGSDDDEAQQERLPAPHLERGQGSALEGEEEEERYSVVDDELDGHGEESVGNTGASALNKEDEEVDAAALPHDIRGFLGDGEGAAGSSTAGGHRTAAFAARAWQRGDESVVKLMDDLNAFYTPFEVLKDLHEKLTTVVQEPLPPEVLSVPLGNHETFGEMRLRYDAMLKNYLGAKLENEAAAEKAVTKLAHRSRDAPEGHTIPLLHPIPYGTSALAASAGGRGRPAALAPPQLQSSDGSPNDGDDNEGPGAVPATQTYRSSPGEALDVLPSPGSGHTTEANRSSEDEDEQDPILGELLPPSRAASSIASCRSPMAQSGSPVEAALSAPVLETSTDERDGKRKREKRATFVMPAEEERRENAPRAAPAHSPRATRLREPDLSPLPNVFTGTLSGRRKPQVVYDLSDASKLRDYAAYDMFYNVPVLRAVYRTCDTPASATCWTRWSGRPTLSTASRASGRTCWRASTAASASSSARS
ncbi:sulfate transporter-like protein [Strigomonas culicis]|uniref:Sulfate transporter-like protein n=1 Tax=Strigomonas culicis TaxID=28005 RepID=S9UVP5_9TRYP|nr:sulfate transporter-like protein [Strigomonas culicis]|eukprot:EPY18571.1 sulfate transporter-like protein [Strigomonas culicis]